MAQPQRIPVITYLSEHGREVIDWVNGNIKMSFTPTGQIYDRVVNRVIEEFPYGPGLDNMHRFLTSAIIASLWCGWFSQARTYANDPNITPEFVQQFQTIINEAYELGRDLAIVEP